MTNGKTGVQFFLSFIATVSPILKQAMLQAQSSSDEDEEAEPRAMERVNATTKRASAFTSRSFESSSDDSESPLAKSNFKDGLFRCLARVFEFKCPAV